MERYIHRPVQGPCHPLERRPCPMTIPGPFRRMPPSGAGDRGSPIPPWGGYFRVHERPPAFEGADGQPYSVSVEVEKVASLTAPWLLLPGSLPRWAESGVGIVGHVETPTLATGVDAVAAREVLEALTLVEVKALPGSRHRPAGCGGSGCFVRPSST